MVSNGVLTGQQTSTVLKHTCIHTRTHVHAHTHIDIHTHTYTHTHTHTHTHTCLKKKKTTSGEAVEIPANGMTITPVRNELFWPGKSPSVS